ncbi:M48 family metallopeptidase [Halobacterium bonnevillei]|uniref:M48 family metalloprotease n=1 Tax=Halobacterium bonnevillei TaxID=2692200 RepID=A0A6B0SIY2_9EURY|nr:M48 family metalloprotease [Halobacterium bonnevillei]
MAIVGSILFAFYSVAVVAAWAFFGQTNTILGIAIVGSVLLVGVQYKIGKWAALRSVGAEDLSEQQYPQIHQFVERVCRDKGMKKPNLKIASMGVPNAFAVGRRGNGTVVISSELIQLLEREELEGVIAHELAHIDNRDVVMMVIGQGIASVVGIVAQYIVLFTGDNDIADFFLAIIVGNLVQFFVMLFVLAISRYREYVADADARRIVNSGDPLARALEKIKQGNERARDSKIDENVNALCIFGEGQGLLQKLVSTHPPTEKRIQRLRS